MTKKQAKAMRTLIANGVTPIKAMNIALKQQPMTLEQKWEKVKDATRGVRKITGDLVAGTCRFAGEAIEHTATVTGKVAHGTADVLKGESELQIVRKPVTIKTADLKRVS